MRPGTISALRHATSIELWSGSARTPVACQRRDAAVSSQREPRRNQPRDRFAVLANSGIRCQSISGGEAEIVCDVQVVEHDAAVHRSISDPDVNVAEGRRMRVGDPRRRHEHKDDKAEAEGDAPGALDRHAVASHAGILTAATVAPQAPTLGGSNVFDAGARAR